METMTIMQLSKALGLKPHAVRYLLMKHHIRPVARRRNALLWPASTVDVLRRKLAERANREYDGDDVSLVEAARMLNMSRVLLRYHATRANVLRVAHNGRLFVPKDFVLKLADFYRAKRELQQLQAQTSDDEYR